jgi:hypothetical protein
MTQNCSCHGAAGTLGQTVAATLERPRYSAGLILEDTDLTAAVDYTRNLNRMLFRNLFGCGVICGLTVSTDRKCGLKVTVKPGLALDGCGDPVELPRTVEIQLDEKIAESWEKDRKPFWIVLCGKEKYCAPRALVCDSDEFDHVTQQTRIRSLAEVTITRDNPKCVCGCPTRDDAQVKGTNGQDPRGNPAVGGLPAGNDSDTDPCQKEHEERVDCADDCGCGSACDCGCCVLLARVEFDATNHWISHHSGVRRLVRPTMVRDREPKPAEPAAAPTHTDTAAAGTTAAAEPASGTATYQYVDAAGGAMVDANEVMRRVGERLAQSEGAAKIIDLGKLGLKPTPEALDAAAKRKAIARPALAAPPPVAAPKQ